MIRRYRLILTVAALLAAAGCDLDGPVITDNKRLDAADVSPKSQWRASTSNVMSGPEQAIDGRLGTAAIGGGAGSDLIIDLGRPCLFNRVAIDHGNTDDESYPRELSVQTSMDGRTFFVRRTVLGTRRITNCTIITPTMARYIRLVVKKASSTSWRVAEVYVQ